MPEISILCYHQVGDSPQPGVRADCFCQTECFRAQMAYLKQEGFSVIGLSEAYRILYESADGPQRAVVLTFDDGYQDFAEVAHPILQAFGFPAVVFAVSGRLGQTASWLSGHAPYLMKASRLSQLENVEIGSHTVSHPFLSRLNGRQIQYEVAGSKAQLEDALGKRVDFFAYPYGDYHSKVRDAVIDAGYRAAFTCSRGFAHQAVNPFEIPRDELYSVGANSFALGAAALVPKLRLGNPVLEAPASKGL